MQVEEGTCASGLPCRIHILTERIVPVPSKIVCLHGIKSHLLKSIVIGENVNLVIIKNGLCQSDSSVEFQCADSVPMVVNC